MKRQLNNSDGSTASRRRFAAYLKWLTPAVGHADRAQPLREYCAGLLLPGDRKSVEPMAAQFAPAAGRLSSKHQSMHHFVADAPWDDGRLLAAVRDYVLPRVSRRDPVSAWILDDTGFPKKGRHSVGVARQYCGQSGKVDNCQTAVSLSLAGGSWSLPVDYSLYLPKEWAEDAASRRKAGVPETVRFQTKGQIALRQLEQAVAAGLPAGVVLADAAYGDDHALREGIAGLGLQYAMGIRPATTVWRDEDDSRRPRARAPRKPLSVCATAQALPATAWRSVTWREGTQKPLRSRFAALRVRIAHRGGSGTPAWLLIEWPAGEAAPTKYFLSNLQESIPLKALVNTVKSRWRIERDYQELKSELGLGHYEGRGWRGFHHHASLCIAAYGFLAAERGLFPPQDKLRLILRLPRRPAGFKPRGAPRK